MSWRQEGRPWVSVIVPTHDRVDLLREALDSVRGQTFHGWELIVIDDCSSDTTPAYLGGLSDPRISHVRMRTNVERSAARNRGLERAAAPFVLFLDDDDRLFPSALERLLLSARQHPHAIASVGGRLMLRPDGSRRRAPHPHTRRVRSIRTDVFFDWVGFPSQSLFRADIVRAADGWNERLTRGEDRDLWVRIARKGPVAFVPDPVVEWRMRPREATGEDAMARRTRLLRDRVRAVERSGTDASCRRTLVASRRWVEGMNAYEVGRYRAARSAFLDMAKLAPRAFASPLVGPMMWRMSLRILVASVAAGDR